ncbi:MAG: ATP-binding protein [Myxococcales bacterium]
MNNGEPGLEKEQRHIAGPEGWFPILTAALRAFMAVANDPSELLATVCNRIGNGLAASCVVRLVSEDGTDWQELGSFRLPWAAESEAEIELSNSVSPALHAPTQCVFASGKPWPIAPEQGQQRLAEACKAAYLPLRSSSHWFGVLLIVRGPDQPDLDTEDVLFAQYFAERAVVAIEHARLLIEARRELEQRQRMAERLRVLAQASRDFAAATTDYRRLRHLIAQTIGENLGEICSIRLISRDGEWLHAEDATVFHSDPTIAREFSELTLGTALRVGEGVAGSVAASGTPFMLNVEGPEQLFPHTTPAFRPLVERLSISSVLVVPLLVGGRCSGVLSLNRRRGSPPYDSDDLRLAQDLADRAALALSNAALLVDLEQRVAENKKAEEKFRGLLESAPDAIVIIDHDGKIVLINAQTEALFGYSRGELLGQTVELLIPAGYRARHPHLRDGYFKAPRLRHAMAAGLDLFGRKKDGSEFAAEINLSPIDTPEGQLVTAVIRDITERKRLEESRARTLELETQNRRAQEANRLKSEFLANMSHELRTPLNAVIGFSALMHAGKVGPLSATQKEYMGDILTTSRHLLQLINDVLDLAKVEAGRSELLPEPVDLRRVTSEVRDILRGLAAEKRIALSISVDDALHEIVTDPRILKQILYNYVSNALKFTPEGGSVQVSVDCGTSKSFTIRVQDTGIGIRPQDMDRLFVEFQQLDSGTAKKYSGTGLGLALTKRLVEAQGGTVAVSSIYGKGSVFSAELPRVLSAS